MTQRFGTSLTTLFSYTWSKALDDSSAIRGVANDFSQENARCRACEVLYNLPFGKGHAILNRGGLVNQIVGGWQVSTIATAQNGLPINTASWGSAGTNFVPSSNRLSCNAGVNAVVSGANADHYLNPAAFRNTLAGEFGNCARNNLIGPRRINFDISAIKDFRLTERQAVQFHMEMFNAPNHVQWGSPNAS